MESYKIVTLICCLICTSSGSPIKEEIQDTKPSATPQVIEHFDQRQNGSENYRIDVDGLVLVVAPAEALLLASLGALDTDIGDFTFPSSSNATSSSQESPIVKPTTEAVESSTVEKIKEPTIISVKPASGRSHLNLRNVFNSLFQRVAHQRTRS